MLACAVTAAAGVVLSVNAAEAVIPGDADCSGEVTVDDVSCIQMVLAERQDIGSFSEAAADVNCNGKTDIKDATEIQRWLAGMETSYPIGSQPAAQTSEQPSQRATDAEGWGLDIIKP